MDEAKKLLKEALEIIEKDAVYYGSCSNHGSCQIGRHRSDGEHPPECLISRIREFLKIV